MSGQVPALFRALVPLSEMFGYVGDLRSKQNIRAAPGLLDGPSKPIAEVPKAVHSAVVKKAEGK
jgi:translation elongation factor EF-G